MHHNNHHQGCECGSQHQENFNVFYLYAFFSGQYFLRMFLSLPLMAQFYQIWVMIKTMTWYQLKDLYFNSISSNVNLIPIKWIKRLFGGFTIPFFVWNFLLFLCAKSNMQNLVSAYFFEYVFWINIFGALFFFIILLFSNSGKLNAENEKNRFSEYFKQRPEIATPRNICIFCQIPKIARSQHCTFCDGCIPKWQKHCFIVNKCIGAGNNIIYFIFQMFYFFFLLMVFLSMFMQKKEQRKLGLHGFLGLLIIFYALALQVEECLVQMLLITYNMTILEITNWRRYTYLWKNKKGEFYNPFNKGLIHNLKEEIEPIFTYNKVIEKGNDEENNQINPSKIGLSPNGIRNWCDVRIFSVLDIPESPFRPILVEKFEQQKNEIYKNMNRNDLVQVNKENEKEKEKEEEQKNDGPHINTDSSFRKDDEQDSLNPFSQ